MKPSWFIAWPVKAPEGWLDALEREAPGGLRWFVPEDLHITLAFLGPFQEAHVREVRSILQKLPPPLETVTVRKLVGLPKPEKCSAVSFEVSEGRQELVKVAEKWRDRILRLAGGPKEPRPPYPHVTVARPDRKVEHGEIRRWLAGDPGEETVLSIDVPAIYTWSSNRKERQFEII